MSKIDQELNRYLTRQRFHKNEDAWLSVEFPHVPKDATVVLQASITVLLENRVQYVCGNHLCYNHLLSFFATYRNPGNRFNRD